MPQLLQATPKGYMSVATAQREQRHSRTLPVIHGLEVTILAHARACDAVTGQNPGALWFTGFPPAPRTQDLLHLALAPLHQQHTAPTPGHQPSPLTTTYTWGAWSSWWPSGLLRLTLTNHLQGTPLPMAQTATRVSSDHNGGWTTTLGTLMGHTSPWEYNHSRPFLEQ